jgi:hypothetical protein
MTEGQRSITLMAMDSRLVPLTPVPIVPRYFTPIVLRWKKQHSENESSVLWASIEMKH